MNATLQEVMESYNEYIGKIPNGCMVIAGLLRQDQTQPALESISNFADGTMWLIETADLLQKNDVKVPLDTHKINSFLDEIVQAIEIQDYYLVADLFEYELLEFFKNVESMRIEQ